MAPPQYPLGVDFAYTEEDESLRTELTDWLDTHLDALLAEWAADHGDDNDHRDAAAPAGGGIMHAIERRRAWQRRLVSGRRAAITWPEKLGWQ